MKDEFDSDLNKYRHYSDENNSEQTGQNISRRDKPREEVTGGDDVFFSQLSQPSKPQRPAQQPQRRQVAPKPEPPKQPEKKPGKKKKVIITAAVLVLVFVLGVVAAVFSTANSIVNKFDYDEETQSNIYVDPDSLQSLPNVYNILLLGVDAINEGEEYPRSDTMMLVSLDKVNKKIKLTSFMRDLYLYIPSYKKDKMNAACSTGGPQLVMDTIEYHFGVDIDAYVMVDFDSFVSIIDQLGGVEVEVTEHEARYIQNNISPDIKAGMNNLNGDSALVYARIRYLDSDFQRTGRQRKVIESLLNKAKGASAFKLLELANQFAPEVKTNLSKSDISFLARNSVYYLTYEIEELCIPRDSGYEDIDVPNIGMALETDLSVARQKVQQFIYPTMGEESTVSDLK